MISSRLCFYYPPAPPAWLTLGSPSLSAGCGTAAAGDGCRCTWTAEQAGFSAARRTGPLKLSPAVGSAWRTPLGHTPLRSSNAPPGESCRCRPLPRAAKHPAQSRLTRRTKRGEEGGWGRRQRQDAIVSITEGTICQSGKKQKRVG